jgi:hypothetical protein
MTLTPEQIAAFRSARNKRYRQQPVTVEELAAEAAYLRVYRATHPFTAAQRKANCDRTKAYARSNPDKIQARRFRAYGLTPEQYQERLLAQDHKCAVCQDALPDRRQTHIDHNHACCPRKFSCGECLRGLLCSNCNRMLGCARDNPAILAAAVAYLAKFPHSPRQP